ncbi:Outer envelope pore protein 24A [Nymphaea thermarum]|nr:Outer envelope pore protein 24A [Nymphaea thermarum]
MNGLRDKTSATLTVTDATFISGLNFNGFSLSVEKPNAFIIDYDIPRKVNPFPSISCLYCFLLRLLLLF